jgi:hypothetical protein
MKKTVLAVLATVATLAQFGCDGSWGMVHDVAVHVLSVGWTADMLNLIP